MTEPSQYFKGRTVQEQMNEVIGYVDVRSAEVATTAIAADVAQVHQDMLDADADASAAAASAAAAAGTLANAVKKTGEASQSIAGNIEVSGTLKAVSTLYATGDASVGGNLGVGGSTNVGDLIATGVVTVPTPTGNTHAANKKYVDDKDALKLNIADVNNYAVGLTGNQGPIAGVKTFSSIIKITSNNGLSPEMVQTDIDWTVDPSSSEYQNAFILRDKNNVIMARDLVDDTTTFRGYDRVMTFYDSNGNQKEAILRIVVSRGADTASLQFYNGSTWRNL